MFFKDSMKHICELEGQPPFMGNLSQFLQIIHENQSMCLILKYLRYNIHQNFTPYWSIDCVGLNPNFTTSKFGTIYCLIKSNWNSRLSLCSSTHKSCCLTAPYKGWLVDLFRSNVNCYLPFSNIFSFFLILKIILFEDS